jgi:group I intron endonuclease
MTTGIYIIINELTEKYYLGSSVNIEKRWVEHKSLLKSNKHHSKPLQNAYNKYGNSCLTYYVFFVCVEEDLLFFEQFCLDTLKPKYNASKVANAPMAGRKHSKETLIKMRKPRSLEHRASISAAQKGKTLSESHKKNLVGFKGKTHSEESRQKMAISARNRNKPALI